MRSLSERTTERLSLSEAAAGRCSSMRTMPTNIESSQSRMPGSALGRRPRRAAPARSAERARELFDGERLDHVADLDVVHAVERSEEHTSELQSLTNLVCRL